ncbi:probable RNA-binding protein 46 [Tribolium madens]|uniref:probable RNA-binding protein 46 n=1 Tax=Tribolium madens TaxID=41895 RepID=UPI001CF74AB2|nr:probable RNA-binding protein 46 [Tribolium madens]
MTSEKYPIVQSNGQRIYKPASSVLAPPPKGSEIFVGNIPRDLFEDELIPLFSQVAPIYKLRLMMDFSGNTRGFAFVTYYTVRDAQRAILKFNKYCINSNTRNSQLTVHLSLDNCRLFFGNVPKDKTKEAIENELKKVVDGIVKVIIYPERQNHNFNRGFAFVEFESHATAAIARRKLLADGVISPWGKYRRLYVDWAEPEPMVDPEIMMQVKILYMKNVPNFWTLERLKNYISKIIGNIFVVRIYKKDNYAFIHFDDRSSAEKALRTFKSLYDYLGRNEKQIEVEWARPSTYSKKNRINEVPDNFCTSVPPRLRKLVRICKRENKLCSSDSSSSSDSDIFMHADLIETENLLAAHLAQLAIHPTF